MKIYAPRKIFILANGEYQEITLEEHTSRRESDVEYQSKKFIGLHGMIMEVSENDYLDFYRAKRRQKYLTECAIERGDVSCDALTTDEFNGENVLADLSEDVAEQVISQMMVDKLNKALLQLSEDEQLLIYHHYYAGIPETELAEIYGITQQAVSKKITKIRAKLKNLIEN